MPCLLVAVWVFVAGYICGYHDGEAKAQTTWYPDGSSSVRIGGTTHFNGADGSYGLSNDLGSGFTGYVFTDAEGHVSSGVASRLAPGGGIPNGNRAPSDDLGMSRGMGRTGSGSSILGSPGSFGEELLRQGGGR